MKDIPSKTWQSCTKQIVDDAMSANLIIFFSNSWKYGLPNMATGVAVIETDFKTDKFRINDIYLQRKKK